jgi:hypothetical protein
VLNFPDGPFFFVIPFYHELGPYDRLRDCGLVSPYRDFDVRCSRCQHARVLRIPDFPIRDARVSSIGYRGIVTSNATIPMYAKTSKCRIPTPSDPLTRVPPIERLGSRREIADRVFLLHNFFTLENSDAPKHRLIRISCHASSLMDGS